MKTTPQLLGAVSALALVVMSSAPAWAVGTNAGDQITNNVSVTYEVGGVLQQRLQCGVGHLLRGVGAEEVGSAVDGMHRLAVGPVAGVDSLEGFVGLTERVEDA